LKPTAPSATNSSRFPFAPGTSPPQKATSTRLERAAAIAFACNRDAVVVGGSESIGMSTTVVTPPAAAAALPQSKPSHSTRPGSSK
jgi:hypothetical protein